MFFTHLVSVCPNQQSGFPISGTSTVNTQSEHEASNLMIAELHVNDTPKKTKYGHFNIWNFEICPSFMVNKFDVPCDILLLNARPAPGAPHCTIFTFNLIIAWSIRNQSSSDLLFFLFCSIVFCLNKDYYWRKNYPASCRFYLFRNKR